MEEINYKRISEFSQTHKLSLLSLFFTSTLYSLYRSSRGKDFGLLKLQSNKSLKEKHVAWIFAYRTLLGTFSILGLGYCSVGLVFKNVLGIDSPEDFQVALKKRFPRLEPQEDEEDTTEFVREVLKALKEEEEYQESEIVKMVSASVRKELGPFAKR